MDQPETITDPDVAARWLLRAVGEEPSGDRERDLISAAHATLMIRRLNSKAGGMVLDAIQGEGYLSWRDLARELGVSGTTSLRRWAEPPSV